MFNRSQFLQFLLKILEKNIRREDAGNSKTDFFRKFQVYLYLCMHKKVCFMLNIQNFLTCFNLRVLTLV